MSEPAAEPFGWWIEGDGINPHFTKRKAAMEAMRSGRDDGLKTVITSLYAAPLQQEADKDVERYRWLRQGHGYKLASQDFWGQSDAEIDAAIEQIKRVREETIEQAAKICEAWAKNRDSGIYADPDEAELLRSAADAIRALKC